MKIISKLLLVLILLVGVVAVFEKVEPVYAANAEPVKTLYRCPMHHQVISDKPGSCPICHMTLVPFGMDEAKDMDNDKGAVSINLNKQSLIGIKTVMVEKRPLHKTVRALGTVSHEDMLYQAELEYLEALRDSPNAIRREYSPVFRRQFLPTAIESAKLKLMQMGLDEETIDQMNQNTPPDKSLLHLAHHEEETLAFTLYEYDLPFVKKGDSVEVQIPSIPGKMLMGKVVTVSSFVDPSSRTVKARARVMDAENQLKPEMSVTVIVNASLGEALAVPRDAVLLTGDRSIVYVEEKEGMFKPREVVLGSQAGEYWQILEGLKEGEKVASEGNFLIDSESRLASVGSES